MDDFPQFGAREPGRDYPPRPGAYAVVFDANGLVLVVEEDGELYLPGGGIDPGESPEQGLHREMLEETGYAIAIDREFARANQFAVSAAKDKAFNKLCRFFTVRLTGGDGAPTVPGNRPSWMTVDEAHARLRDEAHRWALKRALDRI